MKLKEVIIHLVDLNNGIELKSLMLKAIGFAYNNDPLSSYMAAYDELVLNGDLLELKYNGPNKLSYQAKTLVFQKGTTFMQSGETISANEQTQSCQKSSTPERDLAGKGEVNG